MSIIGTGIAAGVANSGQASRQQAVTASGQDAQRADHAGATDKLTLSQLHDAGATRDADEEMPDQAAPGYEQLYDDGGGEEPDDEEQPENAADRIHQADAPLTSPTGLALRPSYGPCSLELPLFHALDIKA